ncbi:MAG: glycosyltransferase [Isosphaeraceae bacterium]
MPVTLVITDLDVGGAERALVVLATGLDRTRWEPRVIALGAEGALVEPLRAAGIATECLDVNRRRPVQAVFRLVRSLRAHRPWLVQSFLFHANLAARLAAPWAGRPWVVGGVRVAERRQEWHLLLDALSARLAVGSVCVSQGVYRYSRDVGRLPIDRLVVIPNGIDPEPFDAVAPLPRESIGVPNDATLALFVGRIDPQKGLPDLLEAARRVVIPARPDWHLALAGDGPSLATLQEFTRASPTLSDRVRWLGRRDDVPSLLKTADVLVLPSHWEGMPNVVLEAMAARLPVVATAVEGSEELVIPGQTGWLVPPKEWESLGAALLDAAIDPERARRFGKAGRARVETDFSIDHVIQSYDELWSIVLGFEPRTIRADREGRVLDCLNEVPAVSR